MGCCMNMKEFGLGQRSTKSLSVPSFKTSSTKKRYLRLESTVHDHLNQEKNRFKWARKWQRLLAETKLSVGSCLKYMLLFFQGYVVGLIRAKQNCIVRYLFGSTTVARYEYSKMSEKIQVICCATSTCFIMIWRAILWHTRERLQ